MAELHFVTFCPFWGHSSDNRYQPAEILVGYPIEFMWQISESKNKKNHSFILKVKNTGRGKNIIENNKSHHQKINSEISNHSAILNKFYWCRKLWCTAELGSTLILLGQHPRHEQLITSGRFCVFQRSAKSPWTPGKNLHSTIRMIHHVRSQWRSKTM